MNSESEGKRSTAKEKRLREAKQSYERMHRTIAPYIRHRRFTSFSTAGQWCEASHGLPERSEE